MDIPFSIDLENTLLIPLKYDRHISRTLTDLRGQFFDTQVYLDVLAKSDLPVYDVYEIKRPEIAGELLFGITHLHPGKVGDEYYITKGHYHLVQGTAEVYYCLKGMGRMVMETPEGAWAVEELQPGRLLYVPPGWAHRSVNTSAQEELIFLFVYPGNAGHDYGSIENKGFRKLVVEHAGKPVVIDNPRWKGF